ncbi:hypothetical protein [Streptomyces sp. NPDC050982]|uniref:hypothetical protein n=1 Tax=Streptomyces sp. NPDC050982 TaxID=3154746 RepID=UPI0033DE86C6
MAATAGAPPSRRAAFGTPLVTLTRSAGTLCSNSATSGRNAVLVASALRPTSVGRTPDLLGGRGPAAPTGSGVVAADVDKGRSPALEKPS